MTERIQGKVVTLRPATLQDRKPVYEWLTKSDLTSSILGPPKYPESEIPSWEEFTEDYKNYFFDSSQPFSGRCFIIEVNGEPVGQINHDNIYAEDNSTELDIWLKSSKYTGKGYGTDALQTLCAFLNAEYSCKRFIIAPSKRNPAAIQAYRKAGFRESSEIPENFVPDYSDAVVMIRVMS